MTCSCASAGHATGQTGLPLERASLRAVSAAPTGLPSLAPVQLCAPVPACPQCGALECLCRPRWVAGMVVSEADLNRLDYYITAKQRLHNKQLFGSGTVCGLVVTCHPCGGGVVSVSPGYALGPCGEDIVVCASDTVDVCTLIQKCRSLERADVECRPWGNTEGCPDLREDWVLAIRYIEQPSRNAPMLRASTAVTCSCGGSGCSCGGGGVCSGSGATTTSPQPRSSMPISCAPTVVCETYRYEVFRAPPQPDCSSRDQAPAVGRLWQNILDCASDLVKLAQNPPQEPLNANITDAGRQRWTVYIGQIKAALYAHLTRSGTGRCDLLEQLCQIVAPAPSLQGQAFVDTTQQVLLALVPIWGAAIQDCVCLVLLPPCQGPEQDPRLPLAVITVDRSHDCNIVDICNWTPLRRIVGTAPNVAYWISGFSALAELRQELFCACCEPLLLQRPPVAGVGGLRLFAERFAAGPEAPPPSGTPFNLGSLGLVGKWLTEQRADPRELLAALRVAPDHAQIDALQRSLTALEENVAELRRALHQPPG
jgi:hypothetical protein